MKRTLRISGIIFAIGTVILAIYKLFINTDATDLTSWIMVSMCLSLLFNGFYFRLEEKQKGSLSLIVIGFSILTLVLIDFIINLLFA
jgi:hypothetical protein